MTEEETEVKKSLKRIKFLAELNKETSEKILAEVEKHVKE